MTPTDIALPRAGSAGRLRARLRSVREWLPEGQLLPEHVWRRRHRTVVWLLWLHVAGLLAFGLAQGQAAPHVLVEVGALAALTALAGWEGARVKVRVIAAAFGLSTASALLVHMWGGVIEAHFHFFVMIGVLTLYQDWVPFLVAIGYVAVHHGVVGVWAPGAVFNHPQAAAHPWRWAGVHAAFVLAASAAHIVAWRTNETQLLRDPLTGLPSRVLFRARLQQAIEGLQRRPGERVAVLFLDLDRFKVINDSLGHDAGDRLISAVAERLRNTLRRHELVARFGGDEFAVLCEGIRDEEHARTVAERVLRALATPFQLPHGEIVSVASVGIAVTADPATDPDELVRDADAAMYRAKEAGGARVTLFDEVTRVRALSRLHMETALRAAIERDELRVHFQPEVAVATGAIVGVEALVRWEHPERGLLAPGEFIPLAEETGLIMPVGEWVLREACRRAQGWDGLLLRVNVSARQLTRGDLPAVVAEALEATGLDPARLCLEITESVLVDDPEASARTLAEIEALGVAIAVDDFGTGYSSLEQLRRFPVDCVKIDRSFVRGIGESAEDAAIVAAVIELGHVLGLTVTAEGVETAAQHDRLRELGCDDAQGFLFGRPEPADTIDCLLARQSA